MMSAFGAMHRYNVKVLKSAGLERYFRVISYLVAICGLAALFVSGAIGIVLFSAFLLICLLAWKLEDSRWQLSERAAVLVILVAIPIFIVDWRFRLSGIAAGEILAASSLAKLILFLSAVKLFQRKSDRDWIFIYLIAFFQILLAAGVSISPLYLVSLLAFVFLAASAIITFEIRKTSREVYKKRARNLKTKDLRVSDLRLGPRKLPAVGLAMVILTASLAVPLFFTLPRVGGAGIAGGSGDMTRLTGFSDSVTLGAIGRLQQNNETVMRVRIDRNDNPDLKRLLWRGVALDRFQNNTWSKSNSRYSEPFARTVGNRFVVNFARPEGKLTVQTVYLEPLNSSVLFAMARPIVIRSSASEIAKDAEGAFRMFPASYERTSYTVFSDTYLPAPDVLRADGLEYPRSTFKYLVVPNRLDPRIGERATEVIRSSGARNRYDIAKAIESHLQTDFGYTLDLKAGGPDPLADFLFNVKEGHCEYFATAMAIMLRTQGIATRVVNGFQQGEFNETAGVYIVRQKNAHSWVEVYFPGERVWVPFDPTPFAGQNPDAGAGGIFDSISGYMEALETFWIQYFVAYDDAEQRSLFRSVRDSVSGYRETGASWLESAQAAVTRWWQSLRGDEGVYSSTRALGIGAGVLLGAGILVILSLWSWRRIAKLAVWKRIAKWFSRNDKARIVGFYARLQDVLEAKGLVRKPHQTPLEFAYATGLDEAVRITEKYNGVRFGAKSLSEDDSDAIENWLRDLEAAEKGSHQFHESR